MKLLTFLILVTAAFVTANSYSQQTKFKMNLENKTVRQIFQEIEKNSEFIFIYSEKSVDVNRKVNVKVENETVELILTQLFEGTINYYEIHDRQIMILAPEMKEPQLPTESGSEVEQPQKKEIKGKITDAKGDPIPGTTVIIKGTTVGTIANSNGEFVFNVLPESKVLSFSFVGYKTQEIQIGNKTTFTVTLEEQTIGVDEVVVVGYGTQKKETVTGSIVSVSSKQLMQSPVSNISNQLVGRMPGLTALQSSGEPGKDASSLKIRGIGTLDAGSGSDPIVVIDGVQRDISVLNRLDANEIDNINILKDASATAVYGVRGANGVIIATTKRGQVGKPQLSFTSNFGVTQLFNMVEPTNSYEHAVLRNEGIRNDNNSGNFSKIVSDNDLWKLQHHQDYNDQELAQLKAQYNYTDAQIAQLKSFSLYYPDHNYFQELFREFAPQNQYNINVSGGTERIKYFTSLGYFTQGGNYRNTDYDGINNNSKYDRYNFRSNFDIEVIKNITATFGLGAQFSNGSSPNISYREIYQKAQMSQPYSAVGFVDGKFINSTAINSPLSYVGGSNAYYLENLYNSGRRMDYQSTLNINLGLKYKLDFITKGLVARGMLAYDNNYSKFGVYQKFPINYSAMRNPDNPVEILYFRNNDEGTWNYSSGVDPKWRKIYIEGGLDYNRTFGEHTVTGLLLYNASKEFNPTFAYHVPNGLLGIVGRVTYSFKNRYLAEFNLGYNGSENFPPETRFGYFPAASVGWIVSDEPFFPKNNIITWFKLRGSYGVVGNDRVGDIRDENSRFLYLPNTWGFTNGAKNGYFFGESGGGTATYYPGANESKIGNPNVTWEKAKKTNIALELKFFSDRLNFTGDYFREERNNILSYFGTIPMVVAASLPPANISKVDNHGYEIQVGWNDHLGKLNYWVKSHVSYARNKVIFRDEVTPKYPWMAATGFGVGQYNGYKDEGFYNTWEQVYNRPYTVMTGNKLQRGDLKYIDIDGDGKISQEDKVPIGYSNYPQYSYGWAMGANYKEFDFSLMFNGTANGSISLNGEAIFALYQDRFTQQYQYDGRWTEEKYLAGDKITYPRISFSPDGTTVGYRDNSFTVKSKDYLRLKNVEIGYTIKKPVLLNKFHLSAVRIYANGNNLITWTSLPAGIDPELNDIGYNSSAQTYPMLRTFNLGFNLQF